MKTIHKIFVDYNTTASQVATQVAKHLAENPASRVMVFAESPNWQQARAAFAAGASDYLPSDIPKLDKPPICNEA